MQDRVLELKMLSCDGKKLQTAPSEELTHSSQGHLNSGYMGGGISRHPSQRAISTLR